MKIFENMLENSAEFLNIASTIKSGNLPVNISGACEAQKAHLIAELCRKLGKKAFVVAENDMRAKRLTGDMRFFSDEEIVYIPPKEVMLYRVEAADHELENRRAEALAQLSDGAWAAASIESLLHFVMPKEELEKMKLVFEYGKTAPSENIAELLTDMGYTRTETVLQKGQFAIRGGIVDIFSPDADDPMRMELFGDDIDSLRIFDCETQLSIEKVDRVQIVPVFKKGAKASMLTYLNDEYIVFFDEPARISEAAKAVEWEIGEKLKDAEQVFRDEERHINSYDEIIAYLEKRGLVGIYGIDGPCPDYRPSRVLALTAKSVSGYNGNIEFLKNDIQKWQNEKRKIVILGGSTERGRKIADFLDEFKIAARFEKEPQALSCEYVTVTAGSISKGFEYPSEKYVVISDREIFAEEKKKKAYRRDKNSVKIKNAQQLEPGDYVVHRAHGIGKYIGIVRLTVGSVTKDYIKIEYRGADYLYLPVGQLDAVGKYTGGGENAAVRLNKLGSGEWANAKRRVRRSVEEMAQRLVSLYAQRQQMRGIEFGADTPWQRDFEAEFPYEETPDQLQSIDEMKKDMESPRPMDRLLCGDVGYGKTEVAMRGAFKAVTDGYQVAYLVPTTILAAQHFNNFKERMKNYPVTVRMLSRFCTPKEAAQTLKMLKSGECDIVVGTHKLLSKNVIFKKLGFLIVDEEQRFGVTHKEKIKEMKKNVDVLTLSATPIPRTLHMAMIGIRDMSVLTMPPSDRYPVQTYVLEYNEGVVKNAIERELSRGGQVYYLHNRVNSIYKTAEKIAALVPNARVFAAHGKMSEAELDDTMMRVQNGEIDVLVCTTIIETGLDIPNVNTIIMENADTLGLSQLYQLRGRVGRTNRLAYAYLTYRKDKALDEVAEKRLRAIKEYTEFGSGFRIAMRDLEIRGAGNVLGPEQHGFMASVGYDMYCSILSEAINEARGLPPAEEKKETEIDLNVNAYIPEAYISSSKLRIEAYKQIAAIESLADKYSVAESFEDRYGEMPKETNALLEIQMLKLKARDIGITEICHAEAGILLRFESLSTFLVEKISYIASKRRGKILFDAGERPYIVIREKALKQEQIIDCVNNVLNDLQTEEK